jgi:drug/metabolite transporter (DMT)-like permease
MNAVVLAWLVASTAVFVAANGVLKTYAVQGGWLTLTAALALFCVGNTLMVQVMRANGLGLAISLSAVFQLVTISAMAMVVFGERPSPLQLAGMALGVVAVLMIAWPGRGA